MKKKILIIFTFPIFLLTSCSINKDFVSQFDSNNYSNENLVFKTNDFIEFNNKIKNNLIDLDDLSFKKIEYYDEWPTYEGLIPNRSIIDISRNNHYYYYEECYHVGAIWEIKRNWNGYQGKMFYDEYEQTLEEGNEYIKDKLYGLAKKWSYEIYENYNPYLDTNIQYTFSLFKDNYFSIKSTEYKNGTFSVSYDYYLSNGLLEKRVNYTDNILDFYVFLNYYF